MFINKIKKSGFTLVETLVGVAVFIVVATAAYQAYISLFGVINQNQYKILALNLANEQFEIIRNLSYADVGIPGGIPNGKIPHIQTLLRGNITFTVTTTIRNIDLPFDGTISSSTKRDLSPADNKVVEVEVMCSTCNSFKSVTLTTTIAPKNLETASTNGALLIKVFDSNGIPVQNADVHIVNASTTPNIVIDDVTDSDGILQVVDAPPGTNAYRITVSKTGYSTDRTYPIGGSGNPNPTKPDATVIIQQLTQTSFSIDKLSTLNFSSVTSSCGLISGINFWLKGSKTIGANVPKYNQRLTTNNSGVYSNSGFEADAYTITIDDAGIYDIAGINPLNPITLDPNATQNVSLIVALKNPKSLLVTVKDSATLLPITGATVHVSSGGYDLTKITGRGSTLQSDWSGGKGQDSYSDNTQYFDDNGSIDVNGPAGEIKLKNVFGSYNSDGILESSTIDTGSPSNFYNLVWAPSDQPILAGPNSVRLQFATATTSNPTSWDYLGPDGTAATYYTSPNSPLSSVHNGDRYARYKVYLNTISATSTPNISDISFTVTSSCTPPGQVIFSNLDSGTYHVQVDKSGYSSSNADINVSSNSQEKEIILTP